VNPKEARPLSRPLPLAEATSSIDASSGTRGIRREYLRCVKAEIKVREEYDKIIKERQSASLEDQRATAVEASGTALDTFLDVVKYRRKHERLRIIQDYVDGLAQKPAASADYLDPKVVLKDAGALPKVPQEVMDASRPRLDAGKKDLNELVDQLEKSVLRAKLLLKREQKLLSKLKAEGSNGISAVGGSKLQALGTTRNELINWIESELGKAGESSDDGPRSEAGEKDYIERQLNSIQRQYSQYLKARQNLILAATGIPEPPVSISEQNETAVRSASDGSTSLGNMSHAIHSYLEGLTSILNDQKSIIQQKSHLTISLAKQLKVASQGLDRLADESHLLPAHPMPSIISQRKGAASFGEEISNYEKPDSSRRARAWVFASDAASTTTRADVLGGLEEGEVAIMDAKKTLVELQRLLGDDGEQGTGMRDIWADLDGHLGVIKSDD